MRCAQGCAMCGLNTRCMAQQVPDMHVTEWHGGVAHVLPIIR